MNLIIYLFYTQGEVSQCYQMEVYKLQRLQFGTLAHTFVWLKTQLVLHWGRPNLKSKVSLLPCDGREMNM